MLGFLPCSVASLDKCMEDYGNLTSSSPLQVPDVQQFMLQYNMQCPMATKRLIFSGMPATVEHGKPL